MKYLIFLLFCACSSAHLDVGLLERDAGDLYACPPLGISPQQDVSSATDTAVTWWNEQIGEQVFFLSPYVTDFSVRRGYVPPGDYDPESTTGGVAGIARLEYSEDGLITSCDITVSIDISYSWQTMVEVIKHELGHCLGLDDDPYSLDLNSIMSDPMVWRGEVTELDRELVLEMLQ